MNHHTGNKRQITEKEFWGKSSASTFWLFVAALSPVALSVYCADHYRLVNADKIAGEIALITALVLIPIMAISRKKLFPWGGKLPVIQWLGMIGCCVPPAALVISIFVLLDVHADKGIPLTGAYLLIRKEINEQAETAPAYWYLTSDTLSLPTTIVLKVSGAEARHTKVGSKIELTLGPGFFKQLWIREYKVLPEEGLTSQIVRKENPSQHH